MSSQHRPGTRLIEQRECLTRIFPVTNVHLNVVRKLASQLFIAMVCVVLLELCCRSQVFIQEFLRKNNIIHADLKPENILLCDGLIPHSERDEVSLANTHNNRISLRESLSAEARSSSIKLADFGNAMLVSQASSYYESFAVQTLWYRAPEV